MSMIIERYLARQILLATAVVAFILLAVAVLGRFLKYLAQASEGKLDPEVLALLMLYRLPEFIQLILPLALLLGILLACGRMYAESEMTALHACGFSKRRLLAITQVAAAAVALLVALLSLAITPWGLVKATGLLEAQKELNEFDVMVPGLFQDISAGARTTYAENIVDGEMQNVFMYENEASRATVARTALAAEDEEGQRFVLFREGSVSESAAPEGGYTVTRFGQLGARMPSREINFEDVIEEKAMTTGALWSSAEASRVAELQWRVSLALLVPILALLAVPLSQVDPRRGRFGRLVPAVLLHILYFGLLLMSRDLTGSGALATLLGLWWVHLLFLALGLLLYWEKLPLLGGASR